jgi:hypothetical protein
MLSRANIYSLVHFDGWVIPDRIEQGATYRAWNNMNKAVKKGALWGDFAVYTGPQELYEALEERAKYRQLYKSNEHVQVIEEPKVVKEPTLEEPSFEPVQLVERAPSALTSFETYPEPVKEPVKEQFTQPRLQKQTLAQKLDKFVKTSPRPLCRWGPGYLDVATRATVDAAPAVLFSSGHHQRRGAPATLARHRDRLHDGRPAAHRV